MAGGSDAERMAAVTLLTYDAALDRARVPALLEGLAGLFRCHFADSFSRTTDYSRFGGVAFGLDRRDYADEFLGVWVKRNVWGTQRPVRMAGEILTTREMMPAAELMRSEMYNDYLAPRELHEGLRLDIWAADGWVEDISLLRPWAAGPYTVKERRMARALLPHLQRSAEVSRRLRREERRASAGIAALEHLEAGVLLLDGSGRLAYRNPAGAALLAEGDGLVAGAEGLGGTSSDVTGRLRLLVGTAIEGRRSGAMRVPRTGLRSSLRVVCMPLRRELEAYGADLADAPAVLVCVFDAQAGADVRLGHLAVLLRLTPAEVALAADLVAGHELRDIAERRGRSVNTVKSQLAGLMAKTDTRRQAELVSFLALGGGEAR